MYAYTVFQFDLDMLFLHGKRLFNASKIIRYFVPETA